ncbi:MAG TPA: SpoIIE family protein phosphatase, partial [Bacteroidia bacterium]|nr:SpoIIE family protein phosphatase [Bacteroidia bacterium]
AAQKAEQDKKDVISEQGRKKQVIIRNIFIGGFALMLALAFFIFRGYRQKQSANIIITQQKAVVEEKQKEILDSIHYAQRIQKALLASDALLGRHLPEYFVLYKPKDIVSGDFYWATEKDNNFYLAVCDSTGHGVPGAFMSLLNISFLNEAITEKNITQPNEVFNHARKRLIENISQEGQQDGMDGVLVKLEKGALSYAAAYNAPIVVRNKEVIELNADKMAVGASPKQNESFTAGTFNLQKGDLIYLFTDGYADQFGGEKGKKFKYKQLQQLIMDNAQLTVKEQKEMLNKAFENWKGSLDQVDDLLVIGIRV